MRISIGLIAGAVLLTGVSGALGGWIGVQTALPKAAQEEGLDDLLHHRLKLTAPQNARIEAMEHDFADRKQSLEVEMRAANQQLADALISEHQYGPGAQRAIERFHAAMGSLQEETARHIMAMRGVLTPDQAAIFDQTIAKSLASPAG